MSTQDIAYKEHDTNLIWQGDGLRLRQCRYGLMLYPDKDRYIGRSLDFYGDYMENEVRLFRQFVKKGDVVLDIGANIGAHTVAFADMVGGVQDGGHVLAFEPQRYCYEMLVSNIAMNNLYNVRAFHAAVSDNTESMMIPFIVPNKEQYLNVGGIGIADWSKAGNGEPVSCSMLDNININKCNFIKIDVEGLELEVLKGGEKFINQHRPVMFVEDDRRDKSPALREFLWNMNYRLYYVATPLFDPINFFNLSDNIFQVPSADNRQVTFTCYNLVCIPAETGLACEPVENTKIEELHRS